MTRPISWWNIHRRKGGEKTGMITVEDTGDCSQRAHVRSGQHQVSSGFHDAIDLDHHEHRVRGQMFQKLAAKYGREIVILIGGAILLGIEKVDDATELLSVPGNRSGIHFARVPIITAANFAVAELGFERRGDLEIDAHLENTIALGSRW